MSWRRDPRLIVVGWSMRHIHITLDAVVLYGVLLHPADDERRGTGVGSGEAKTGPALQLRNSTSPTRECHHTGEADSSGRPSSGVTVAAAAAVATAAVTCAETKINGLDDAVDRRKSSTDQCGKLSNV